MYSIYNFNIKGYGIYVAISLNVNKDIISQYRILKNNTHHCLTLQLLWNLYPELFSHTTITEVNKSLINIVSYKYRKSLPFVIDSVFRSELITSTTISRRYMKHELLYMQRDFNNLVYVYDKYGQHIGLEVAHQTFETGWYYTHRSNSIRRLS